MARCSKASISAAPFGVSVCPCAGLPINRSDATTEISTNVVLRSLMGSPLSKAAVYQLWISCRSDSERHRNCGYWSCLIFRLPSWDRRGGASRDGCRGGSHVEKLPLVQLPPLAGSASRSRCPPILGG